MFGNIVLRQNLLSHIVGGLVSQRDMGMCGGGGGVCVGGLGGGGVQSLHIIVCD